MRENKLLAEYIILVTKGKWNAKDLEETLLLRVYNSFGFKWWLFGIFLKDFKRKIINATRNISK